MKVAAEMIIDVSTGSFSRLISLLTDSGCEIQKTEIVSHSENSICYTIDIIYDNAVLFKLCQQQINDSGLFTIQKTRNYLDDIISGGFIEVKNAMKIETLSDYEMNVLGVYRIAAEKIRETENPSSSTGIWKNTGIITGMNARTERSRSPHYLSYAESELSAAIIARFSGKNGFPLILSYDLLEDFIKMLSSLEPTFSSYRITHTDDDNNPDWYTQLNDSISIPVLSKKMDEIPAFILSAVLRLSRKHKFRIKDSTVGFIGMDISAVRLSNILTKLGFLRILGYDNNEKTMLHFERTGGLATTPEHIFGNSDIVVILKEQFTEDDLVKIRPGNIVISALDESSVTDLFSKRKVCRDILGGSWIDTSVVMPGMLSGLLESGEKKITDTMLISIGEMLSGYSENISAYPSVFSDIHEKISNIICKK